MKEINRSNVQDEYKWNLETMIKDEQEFQSKYDEATQLINELASFEGRILNSGENLKEFLTKKEELDRITDTLYIYAHMLVDTDSSVKESQKLKQQSITIEEQASSKLSFVKAELLSSNLDEIKKLLKEVDLFKYSFYFEKLYRYQDHTLTKEEEQIISEATLAMGTGHDAFYSLNNTDILLGNITVNGEKIKLTNSNYIKYVSSKDRSVRRQAFETLYQFYKEHQYTIFSCLSGNIKENLFLSKVKKYSSPLEQSLYQDSITPKVYLELINRVHNHLDSMYEYMDLRKKALNLDQMHMYDIYVDITDSKAPAIDFESGKKLIFDSLKVLGKDYLDALNKAFLDKWIDIYPNKYKKSGAYSWGSYDSYPYLLLNYDDTLDSVSTMAHELGHSMHSYYSKLNNDYIYHNYPIFLAEIASTVNEIILNDYLIKHAKDKNEKILYLNEFLEKVRTTIYRQTMFAEFEMILHDKKQENIPLTLDDYNQIYYDLNKLYYGDSVISDEEIKYEWMRIPHFYTSFYVYKYATGFSCALAIAYDIINGSEKMKEKYLEFLSSGCSKYPLDILKDLNIDLEDGTVINKALELFNDKLNELKELINKD